MKNKYTLSKRYQLTYLNRKEKNFIETIINMLTDIDFNQLYDFVTELIDGEYGECDYKYFGNKKYLKMTFDDNDETNIYVRPIYSNEENIKYIKQYYSLDNEIRGLRIADHITSFNLEIYADYTLTNIVFNSDATCENKNLIIKDKHNIIYNNFNDLDYIVWIISVVGDYLFEFEKENEKDQIDILKIMQESLDKIVNEYYSKDECKPIFKLNIRDSGTNAKIILSIEHLGSKFSEVIFPCEKTNLNEDFNLCNIMRSLYNRTM